MSSGLRWLHSRTSCWLFLVTRSRLAKAPNCCPAEPVGLLGRPISETLEARDPETRFLLALSPSGHGVQDQLRIKKGEDYVRHSLLHNVKGKWGYMPEPFQNSQDVSLCRLVCVGPEGRGPGWPVGSSWLV